jgi:predicted phage terminase large subunit-like protein
MPQLIQVPEVFRPLYESKKRYKVFHGGRGGGKTWQIADYLVICMLSEPKDLGRFVYLCLRKTMESLKYSSKPTIMRSIYKLGVQDYFYTTSTSPEIKCKLNSGSFLFRGCKNVDEAESLKSTEHVRKAWYEEARTLTQDVWTLLTPTVRMSPSEILLSFNPIRKNDFVYDHFIVNRNPLAEVVQVNYYDNPFFVDNEALMLEVEAAKAYPELYRRVWLGEPGLIENQLINPEWWQYYDSLDHVIKMCTGMFITADTAYKTGTLNDYSVIQLWGYEAGRRIYLLNQIRGKWQFPELVDKMTKFTKDSCALSSHIVPSRIYIEDKASGISLVQTCSRAGMNAVAWKPKDYQFPEDKVGRANESALIISMGCVYLPRNAIWVPAYVTEHAEFTEDDDEYDHDDQVDGTTMAMSIWRRMGGGRMPLH